MALDRTKTDAALGEKVHEYLLEMGVETPMAKPEPSQDEKFDLIKVAFTEIMKVLGLDLSDDSLCETPKRVTKMYLNEIFWGLDYSNFPKITTIENKMQYENVLLERHIKVSSSCEHHFIPMMGDAFIAYLPDRKVIGAEHK